MSNNQKGILYACVTALFWGFLAVFLKVAVQRVDPVTIVWFRFLVAFSILLVWHLIRKPRELKILIRPPRMLLYAAMALSWNYLGFMMSVHFTSPSNGQLIVQAGPILFTLAGIIFFRERLRRQQLIGFALAITGFILFYSQQIQLMIGQKNQYNIGVLFALSAAVTWATYAVLQKKLVLHYSSSTLNLFLFGFPVIFYFPFVNLEPFAGLNFGWWALMIFLGLNTLIAYGCLAQALRYTEANKVSIILLLNPIITFITMGILTTLEVSWISGEHFSAYSLFGALIVLTGDVFVIRKSRREKQSQHE